MDRFESPQARCRAGLARADVTPPVGIYHRLWGAAAHERATAVHRPLDATALWFAGPDGQDPRVIIAVDQCLLDAADVANIRKLVREAVPGVGGVRVTCSHTHASGWMSRSREPYPGGELIGPYLRRLGHVCAEVARHAADKARPANIVFGTARCALAQNRDLFDRASNQFVCGYNPAGPADDTVVVGRITGPDGVTVGTIVNYACHPTTLAWENTAISPDFVGAMREVVANNAGAPCLFLQGAAGDLGPREGFVGDPLVADRNGRQLGFAALAGLATLPRPGTRFAYAGPVVSGATLGTWTHEPVDADTAARYDAWLWKTITVELPYRMDLPAVDDTRVALSRWEADEQAARARGDTDRARDCRAHAERMTRQLNRLSALPAGKTYSYPVALGRTGTALWVLVPGELYQAFQSTLRARFPDAAVLVVTLTDDWQPGYLPTASSYGYGIYQETIAVLAPGSLEVLTETVCRELRAM